MNLNSGRVGADDCLMLLLLDDRQSVSDTPSLPAISGFRSPRVQVWRELASAALVVTELSNRKWAGSDQILLAWDLALRWVVFNMSQHLISSALVVSQLNPFCCGPDWRSHISFFNHLQVFLCSNKHATGLLCSEFLFIGIAGVQREPLTDASFIWLAYGSFYILKWF